MTSSINAAWPPIVASHNRVRGFFDETILQTTDDAASFAQECHNLARIMHEQQAGDRFSVRAVMHNNVLPQLEEAGLTVEAALPIYKEGIIFWLGYISHNGAHRAISPNYASRHDAVLRHVAQKTSIKHPQPYEPQLVSSDMSNKERLRLLPKFIEPYSYFDYDEADVAALLCNPKNTITYVEENGIVLSTAMAELGTVAIKGFGELHLAEVTEAYTRASHRGQGLYKLVSGYLQEYLTTQRSQGELELDVLYGESNLAMPGVLIAAHQNGRRFSYFDAVELGVYSRTFGILAQNFSVNDGCETRPYNDFAVSYVPLSEVN